MITFTKHAGNVRYTNPQRSHPLGGLGGNIVSLQITCCSPGCMHLCVELCQPLSSVGKACAHTFFFIASSSRGGFNSEWSVWSQTRTHTYMPTHRDRHSYTQTHNSQAPKNRIVTLRSKISPHPPIHCVPSNTVSQSSIISISPLSCIWFGYYH